MTDIQPGVYDGIADVDYHAGPGVSSTMIRQITRPGGPARLHYEMATPQVDTAAFVVGKAAHSLVLGAVAPVACAPKVDRRTKAGKAAYAEFEAGLTGDTIVLKPADYDTVMGMAEAVLANPDARALLETEGKPEQSVYWYDDATGLLCKARPDYLPTPDSGDVFEFVDYKTTTDASPHGFQRALAQYGYDQAAAWYAEGLREAGYHDRARMVFIAQEKTPPFLVAVYPFDHTTLLDSDGTPLLHQVNHAGLKAYQRCLQRDEWPGYDTTNIALPVWRQQQLTNF